MTWFLIAFLYPDTMHSILLILLRFFARAIIYKHKPYVIGITGTVGKTTLSHNTAIYLSSLYGDDMVRVSPYHYNGEYGLPLTLIWARTGGRNIFRWMSVFFIAITTYIRPYPKYLILEYGIDHPWEMEYLLSVVRPDIALLSPIAPNHMEQFVDFSRYRDAKYLLVKNTRVASIVHESHRVYLDGENMYFYGTSKDNDIYIQTALQRIYALDVSVSFQDCIYTFSIPAFGSYQAENMLPLYALWDILGGNVALIWEKASHYTPEIGRSRILRWVGDSYIIDGSYNGGFESICRGIDSLVEFIPLYRIICLLGDMRELGMESESMHRDLAHYITQKFEKGATDVSFFLVGPLMSRYVAPTLSEVFSTKHDISSRRMGDSIRDLLFADMRPTIIYVKWSQNTIFLEEWIKSFLSNEVDISMLCRQSDEWMTEKERYFASIGA